MYQVAFPLELPDGTPVLIRSPGFPAGRRAVYTADWTYTEAGVPVVEEYKGYDDGESRLRRGVFEALYGVRVRLTGPAATAQARARARIAARRAARRGG